MLFLLLFHSILFSGQLSEYAIVITTEDDNVAEGEDFYFQCSTEVVVTGIQLVIDGSLENEPKLSRIIVNSTANNSANFTFLNVSRDDQGTEFQCYANSAQRDGNQPRAISSAPLYFNIQCANFNNVSYYKHSFIGYIYFVRGVYIIECIEHKKVFHFCT